MKRNIFIAAAVLAGLSACSGGASRQPAADAAQPANAAAPAPVPEPAPNQASAAKPAPLPEPKGPIDPKSVEAAGQVVQHYGALIEQGRMAEAARLWGDRAAARAFAGELAASFREVHLEIGDLGDPEGAAGSVYTTMPASFYGESKRGEDVWRQAWITLRRVNDVPGSTEEQRRWHIERIEWRAD